MASGNGGLWLRRLRWGLGAGSRRRRESRTRAVPSEPGGGSPRGGCGDVGAPVALRARSRRRRLRAWGCARHKPRRRRPARRKLLPCLVSAALLRCYPGPPAGSLRINPVPARPVGCARRFGPPRPVGRRPTPSPEPRRTLSRPVSSSCPGLRPPPPSRPAARLRDPVTLGSLARPQGADQ